MTLTLTIGGVVTHHATPDAAAAEIGRRSRAAARACADAMRPTRAPRWVHIAWTITPDDARPAVAALLPSQKGYTP